MNHKSQNNSGWKPATWTDTGCAVFAIGDVHGQAGALAAALGVIEKTDTGDLERILVFTGDIIDRGPENLRAVDLVRNAKALAAVDRAIVLPGNHELMMTEALVDPYMALDWQRNGGIAVIEECQEMDVEMGIERSVEASIRARLGDLFDIAKYGDTHLRLGDLLFVHAGIHPNMALQDFFGQDRFSAPHSRHFAWIRDQFLNVTGPWEQDANLIVIHGHTVALKVNDPPRDLIDTRMDLADSHARINIDAGAAARLPQVGVFECYDGRYRVHVISEKNISGSPK